MKWLKKIETRFKGKEVPEVEEYKLKDNEMKKLSESFVSRDEKYIASLGNGYIMNYLANKSVKKGFAFITDKRVYFKGSCLSGTGKKLVKTNEERTVDVKNITGSGFTYHRHWGILVALFISILVALAGAVGSGIVFSFLKDWYDSSIVQIGEVLSIAICLSLAIICCIGIKNYLLKRKTLFRIEYAGGCIAFNVSFYAKAEIDDFQKQLRRAKDMAEESTNIKVIPTETPIETVTQNNAADDLRKYAELLKEGLITQEEYDAMKKKVLGL